MISGFTEVKAEKMVSDRLIINLTGQEKTGKTHFSLTAPGPIAYFDLDIGAEGVVNKFCSTKRIFTRKFKFDGQPDDIVKRLWEDFKKTYYEALKDATIKTIIVDTGSDVWELLRLARFGKLTQIMSHRYTEVNSEMRSLIRDAYGYPKTVIWTHRLKDEYVNNTNTGKMKLAGFNEVPYLVQLNIETFVAEGLNMIRIIDCRQNKDLRGLELPADGMDFEQVLSMVYAN